MGVAVDFASVLRECNGGKLPSDVVLRPTRSGAPSAFHVAAQNALGIVRQRYATLLASRVWYLDSLRLGAARQDDEVAGQLAEERCAQLDAETQRDVMTATEAIRQLERLAIQGAQGLPDLEAHHLGVVLVIRDRLGKLVKLDQQMRAHRARQALDRRQMYAFCSVGL